jgi:two-component system, sensor histidine kinase
MSWRLSRFRFGSALIVATAAVTVAMAVLLGFELTQRNALQAQTGERVDSITAPAFLLDREFLRFHAVIDAYLHADNPPELDEVRLRLDILASKVMTVRESPGSELLFAQAQNVAIVDRVQRMVEQGDRALQVEPVDRAALTALSDEIDGFTAETQALGNAADLLASRVLETQNRELLAQNFEITALTLLQLVLLMATATGLLWRYRVQQREQAQLEALNERLTLAQQAAERANRGKSMFLANMSHELRTPFNGVVGLLDVLSTTPLNHEQTDLISTVKESASHLLKLLNDILDMSALEAGKISFHIETVDLLAVLRDVESVMRPLAEQKQIGFTLEHRLSGAQWMRTDATRLRQILFNLLNNAIKFTEQGCVCLGVQINDNDHGGRDLCLSIVDSGIGMDKAALTQLFQRFFQVDSGLARRFSGAGLGLEISMSLARVMDGDIAVTSQAGHGSTFTVRLPWIESEAPAPTHAQRDVKDALNLSEQPLKVLVAEDHIVNQKFLGIVLQRMGHHATFADNGELALKAFEDGAFDVVLMDIHMPVMDGLSVTRAIRARTDGRESTPIIALTADVLDEAREQAMSAGVNTFLTKPVQLPELRKALNAVSTALG